MLYGDPEYRINLYSSKFALKQIMDSLAFRNNKLQSPMKLIKKNAHLEDFYAKPSLRCHSH
jgi:hypothetical protein